MNVLWVSFCTTSMCPNIGNIVEMAWTFHMDGVPDPFGIRSYKAKPLRHTEDEVYGKHNVKKFVAAYNAKHGADPRKHLDVYGDFHFSKDVLTYEGLTPIDLEDDNRVEAMRLLALLIADVKKLYPGKKFYPGGYFADHFSVLLHEYSKRTGFETIMKDFLDYRNPVEVLPAVRLAKAVGNLRDLKSVSLPEVSSYFGLLEGRDAYTKLQNTLLLSSSLLGGAVDASQSVFSRPLPAAKVGIRDRPEGSPVHNKRDLQEAKYRTGVLD